MGKGLLAESWGAGRFRRACPGLSFMQEEAQAGRSRASHAAHSTVSSQGFSRIRPRGPEEGPSQGRAASGAPRAPGGRAEGSDRSRGPWQPSLEPTRWSRATPVSSGAPHPDLWPGPARLGPLDLARYLQGLRPLFRAWAVIAMII